MVAHAIGQAQICGENMICAVQMVAYNGVIPHALVSIIGPEHRLSTVYRLPVKAVLAQAEIHLFAIRAGFLFEVHNQITLHAVRSLPGAFCAKGRDA